MGLVAHWKLDGDAKDSKGSHDGTIHGSPTVVNGKIGDAYEFDGSNDYIELDNFKFSSHTLSCWVNSDMGSSGTGSNVTVIFGNYDGGDAKYTHLGIEGDNLYWCIDDGSNSFTEVGRESFNTDKWYHMVLTYNSNGITKAYLDGDEINSINYTSNIKFDSLIYYIGRQEQGHYFDGLIDDVRIYDHALSKKEIKELSKAKVLHYKMDTFAEPTENLMNTTHPNGYEYGGTGYDFFGQTWTWSELGVADGESVTLSALMKIDQVRKDAGGSVRMYIYTSNSGDSWGQSTSIGTTSLSYSYFTRTITRNDSYLLDDGNPATHVHVRFYHMPSSIDDGLSCIKNIQFETKDHATPFVDGVREGRVTDSSGYDNHAELDNNTPQWIEGSVLGKGCYKFDGISQGVYLDEKIQINNEFTILYWFKPFRSTNYRIINGIGYANSIWHLDDNTIRFDDRGYSGSVYNVDFPNNTIINEWNCLIVRKDKNNNVDAFLNGEWSNNSVTWQDYLELYNIGYKTNNTSWSPYEGLVDNVVLFKEYLSENEVKELYQQRVSIDDRGNLYAHNFQEPREKTLIEDSTYSVNSNEYKILAVPTPEDTNFSAWVESNDTLGNVILEGWVYISSLDFPLSHFEFTKDNNDKGIWFRDLEILYPTKGSWSVGWNYIRETTPDWDTVSTTPWDDMTRLQLYRDGAGAGDSSEIIRLKDIKLRKFPNNQEIKFNVDKRGTNRSQKFKETAREKKDKLLDWYADWGINTTGNQGAFSDNGGANENEVILHPDPWGKIAKVWKCTPDTDGNASGGWNASFNDDNSHRLRMSVFVKRTGDNDGTTYFGCDNGDNTLTLNDNIDGNPYFWAGNLPSHDDTWYLMVGVVHPNSYTGSDMGIAGVYDMQGNKVIDATEYKWGTGTRQEMRAYLHYSETVSNRQYFVYPRVDIMDGSEPSIADLLKGYDAREYHIDSRVSQKEDSLNVRGQFIEN